MTHTQLYVNYEVEDYEPLTLKVYQGDSIVFAHSGYRDNEQVIGLLQNQPYTVHFVNEGAGG